MPQDDFRTGASFKGRGTSERPGNRFESYRRALDPAILDADESVAPEIQLLTDHSRTIIARNASPDVGFEVSINPYRGCEHGCIYCYARPTHEYLGFSAGIDFETKILVKEAAPELLRSELSSPRWEPKVVSISGVTDAYQPIERKLKLTRRCLEVLTEFRNPVGIITKNALVVRDLDLLFSLHAHRGAVVYLSVTTLDAELCGVLEPRTSRPAKRLDAIRRLADAGIPVGVNVAPVIPGLTDHEMSEILKAAFEAGARYAGYVPLRLPYAVAPLFEDWLGKHFPERKEKVLGRIRSLRAGMLNDANFGTRMRGEGVFAENMANLFRVTKRKLGFSSGGPGLSSAAFRRLPQPGEQLDLFTGEA